MKDTITRLIELGFSKTEAAIYIALLQMGKANGYKLTKELGLSKSTIYQALDVMYKNGYILMIPNGSKEYEAKDPEILFESMEKRFFENSINIKKDLAKLKNYGKKDFFYKLEGMENINKTFSEIINNARKEIYLNTDFNLLNFKNELKAAIERGVRIIAFCFNKLDSMGLKIEIYHKSNLKEDYKHPSRIMAVIDLEKSFVVTKVNDSIDGIYTDNKVFTKIIAEHIHSDIYMAKLAKVYEETFNESIKVDTMHERNDLIK